MEKILKALSNPINPSVILILGLFTVLWGAWVLSPFWTVFTQAPLYVQMAEVASEPVWGLFAIGSGLFTIRGAVKPSYMNLRLGSWAATAMWSVITVMYFIGDWASTGGITTLCFAVYAFFVWLNVRMNRELYETS